MRRSSILVLCSSTALLPVGNLFLVACFGSSTSPLPTNADAGLSFPDSSSSVLPPRDGGGAAEASRMDGAPPEVDGGPPELDGALPETGTADTGSPGATLATTPVDFGLVDCGSTPSAQSYAFTNTGAASLTYSATIAPGSVFSIQGPASGSVAPGESGSLSIAATSVPTSSTAGVALIGTLTLTTNVPGEGTVDVPLTLTPQGASLTVMPAVAGFGSVQLSTPATPIPLTVTNTGNAPVSVTLGTPTDPQFSVTYTGQPAAAVIPPGGTLAGAQAGFVPTSAVLTAATAAIQTTGALCASAASSIALSGSGTSEPVSIGPNPLDFGAVNCGTAGTAAPVTLKNGYAFAITYTATLGKGASSPYTVTAMGTVPAAGQAALQVVPKVIALPGNIAPGAYDDTLTVSTTAPGSSPTVVSLTESAQGAILAVSMPNSNFGSVPVNVISTLPFSVTNTGNVLAALTVTTTGTGFGALFDPGAATVAAGGTSPGGVTFAPSAPASVAGTLTVTTTAALCSAPPAPISLSAQASGPTASVSTAGLTAFGVTCTLGASATQAITLSNTGNAALSVTAVATTSGRVTVVSAPTTIAAGSTGQIVLQAKAAVVGTDAAGTYADSLSFTTNEFGSPTHTVPLSVVVHGANLAFSPSSTVALTGVCHQTLSNYSVTNTGDMAAVVTGPTNDDATANPANFDTAKFCGGDPVSCTQSFNEVQQESTFQTGATVAAMSSVGDTIGVYDLGCFDFSTTGPPTCEPCTGTDLFTYSETGDVCIPLPTLTYEFDYGNNTNCTCT
jgi:hypothetical protein